MIELTPPIEYGRKQRFGITSRIIINGKWENVKKVTSQNFGNTNSPNQDAYEGWGLLGHNGTDIVIYTGDPILASHDGTILFVGFDTSGGVGLDIWNKEGSYKTRYWHNLQNLVRVGDEVKRGDLVAYGDNTGFSTGSHLHFSLKLTDTKGRTINGSNGYRGAIDDVPFRVDMNTLTEADVTQLYQLAFNRDPDASGLTHYTGKTLSEFHSEIMQSEEKMHYKSINEAIKRLENWARGL